MAKSFLKMIQILLTLMLEIALRVLSLMCPMGIYMLLVTFRNKISKFSGLPTYITDNTVWQFVYPGTALVVVDPTISKKRVAKLLNYVKEHKYDLYALFCIIFLLLIAQK